MPDGEQAKRVAPSQRLGVRPTLIDFGVASAARGQILDSVGPGAPEPPGRGS